MLFISTAFAHPSALPHLHGADPAAAAILVFWALVTAVFFVLAFRRRGSARTSSDAA